MAMRHGGIFLANEITRLDSGEQMNLAEVLDSRASITIPDTGEVVMADPNFRFIATGNSGGYGDDSGVYQGERISSVAFLDRFQVFKVGHMDATDEQALLQKLAPSLPVAIVEGMVKLAGEVRKNFVGRGGT
ncbi:AAA family ATPase, partial [Acinetobacter baumannii]